MLFDSRKEMDQATTQKMMTLVFELLCQSDLMLAKVLRKKVIEKCESKRVSPDQFSSMTFTSSITLKSRYVSHMESSETVFFLSFLCFFMVIIQMFPWIRDFKIFITPKVNDNLE